MAGAVGCSWRASKRHASAPVKTDGWSSRLQKLPWTGQMAGACDCESCRGKATERLGMFQPPVVPGAAPALAKAGVGGYIEYTYEGKIHVDC